MTSTRKTIEGLFGDGSAFPIAAIPDGMRELATAIDRLDEQVQRIADEFSRRGAADTGPRIGG